MHPSPWRSPPWAAASRRWRHHAIRAVRELIDSPELLWLAGERRHCRQLTVRRGGQRALGSVDRDLEERRSRIPADAGDGRHAPLLLRLHQVGGQPHVDLRRRPAGRHVRRLLCRNGRRRGSGCRSATRSGARTARPTGAAWTAWTAGAARTAWATPAPRSADGHAFHRELEHGARSRRLDPIGAFAEVLAGHRPPVAPEQRPDVEHADAAAVEIGLVVTRELLHAVAEIEQTEVPRSDEPAAGAEEQLAPSLQHVDAHVVEERARYLAGAAHPDVVAGGGPGAARSVRHEQVVPAVALDHDRGFGVDGDVGRRAIRVEALAGPRIQFDETDVAEVGTVGEPEPAVGGVVEHARVDGVAVFDAVGPDDRAAVFPLVVR